MTSDDLDEQVSRLLDRKDEAGIVAALEAAGADGNHFLTYRPTLERFPLLAAAIERGWGTLALWLIERGADVRRKHNGLTPLMLACGAKDHRIIAALVARGVPLEEKSPKGEGEDDETALMISAGQHDLTAVRILLAAGADAKRLNRAERSALHAALAPKPTPAATQIVTALLDAGCPLTGAELHHPIARRDVETVKLLLARGCPVDAPAPRNEYDGIKKGDTPLTLAVNQTLEDTTDAPDIGLRPTNPQRLELIPLLLAAGADPNQPSAKGRTPLMIAVQQRQIRTAEMLVKAGADPALVPAGAKESPASFAAAKKLEEFTRLFAVK